MMCSRSREAAAPARRPAAPGHPARRHRGGKHRRPPQAAGGTQPRRAGPPPRSTAPAGRRAAGQRQPAASSSGRPSISTMGDQPESTARRRAPVSKLSASVACSSMAVKLRRPRRQRASAGRPARPCRPAPACPEEVLRQPARRQRVLVAPLSKLPGGPRYTKNSEVPRRGVSRVARASARAASRLRDCGHGPRPGAPLRRRRAAGQRRPPRTGGDEALQRAAGTGPRPCGQHHCRGRGNGARSKAASSSRERAGERQDEAHSAAPPACRRRAAAHACPARQRGGAKRRPPPATHLTALRPGAAQHGEGIESPSSPARSRAGPGWRPRSARRQRAHRQSPARRRAARGRPARRKDREASHGGRVWPWQPAPGTKCILARRPARRPDAAQGRVPTPTQRYRSYKRRMSFAQRPLRQRVLAGIAATHPVQAPRHDRYLFRFDLHPDLRPPEDRPFRPASRTADPSRSLFNQQDAAVTWSNPSRTGSCRPAPWCDGALPYRRDRAAAT